MRWPLRKARNSPRAAVDQGREKRAPLRNDGRAQGMNLKLTPRRMRLAVRETALPAATGPQADAVKAHVALPRSTNRYSALAVRFSVAAYSAPAPAAQPNCVALS